MTEYKIEIRATKEEENPIECFLEEINQENFDEHFRGFVADINNTDGIARATFNGNEIYISTALDADALKNKLKHLFSNYYCHIRFVGIHEILT